MKHNTNEINKNLLIIFNSEISISSFLSNIVEKNIWINCKKTRKLRVTFTTSHNFIILFMQSNLSFLRTYAKKPVINYWPFRCTRNY